MTKRKGIILAGGSGSRLYPLTKAVTKQLLPIYDKPMIYYPLTTLMLAGIYDILIITTQEDLHQMKRLLSNGSQWGINLSYKIQPKPEGLAQALILGEEFLKQSHCALILGDNLFFGQGLSNLLRLTSKDTKGATMFTYHVSDPERYGVVKLDNKNKNVLGIEEKPINPPSNFAITGLYFFDETATDRAKQLKPSSRGELEITDLLKSYLYDNILNMKRFGRGYAWLDTGTYNSLLEAGNFVKTITERQGLQVGSPEDVALEHGLINL